MAKIKTTIRLNEEVSGEIKKILESHNKIIQLLEKNNANLLKLLEKSIEVVEDGDS